MKIALIGYGKMGRMIEEIAVARGHEIVSIIDVDNRDAFASEAFRSADVAIEFTAPQAAYDNYMRAFAHHVKVVSGSTGWIPQHGEEVKRMCEKEGQTLFWSSNFSLGVTIFRAVNRYLARIMNQFDDYTPSMEEVHHVHKLDHPSGTAITLAEDILTQLDRETTWCLGQATRPDELPIAAIREGQVPGTHTIRYDSPEDTITITHEAKNRQGFALGAVLAAEFIIGKKGFFTMHDLLHF